MTKKLNQKGFSLIEAMLVIIALALVVFVGYYVYHSQKSTDKTYSAASKDAQSTPSKKSTATNNASVAATDANLQVYLIKTCGASNGAAINQMFANKSQQTVDSDNYQLEGNYAISNVACDLSSGMQLTTVITKFKDGTWSLVVDKPVGVSCDFLTTQGFPDKLKAPYCSNGEQQLN